MYEAVHAAPDGDSTVARLALTAGERGYDGVVVRSHGDARPEYDPAAVAERFGVDVVRGVEIRAEDPERASGFLGADRADHVVVALHGGSERLNRFGANQDRVDVLAHPHREDAFDEGMAKAAREHGVRVEFDLGDVLRADGGPRVRALQRLRTLRDLVEHVEVPYVATGGARSHLQLRAPRELVAVGETVGLGGEFVREGLREWGRLVERNRERQSDAFVEPGVRRGRYDDPEERAARFDEKTADSDDGSGE